MGPTSKKKQKLKKKQKEALEQTCRWRTKSKKEKKNIFLFLLFKFSQIYENRNVGFRRDKHGKCSTPRGLRVSTRNT